MPGHPGSRHEDRDTQIETHRDVPWAVGGMSVGTDISPRVRVVTVNYNGGHHTLDCIAALEASTWPNGALEIVLVDNGSTDGVVDQVRTDHPDVKIVESPENRGFAGGCNLGLQDLDDVEYVALVNNDATVAPGWLSPLVDVLSADQSVGAACPKILFAAPCHEIGLRTVSRSRAARRHDVGVRVAGARVGELDVSEGLRFPRGFWGSEVRDASVRPGRWTREDATLLVPTVDTDPGEPCQLLLWSCGATTLEVTSGEHTSRLEIDDTKRWYEIPSGGTARDIVNNVGSELDPHGHAVDRGYLEFDNGQYEVESDVFAWCGAGVLLRSQYLRDVGLFDERLFLYYEDLELSWRGQRQGWRYRYVPQSIIRHVHSATTIADSPLSHYYGERNRLLVLTRHAAITKVARAVVRFLLITGSYARRDVFGLMGRRCIPDRHHTGPRLKAFLGFVRLAPKMIRERFA